MNVNLLEKHFARMGIRIKIEREPHFFRGRFSVNVSNVPNAEHFTLAVNSEAERDIEIEILQVKPKDRHLVLLIKDHGEKVVTKDRFLCGHDEREWFVAAVPGKVSTVANAMESLKPEAVRQAQARFGLNQKQRNCRRNRAFRRQGEWFFLPVVNAMIDESKILRDEPIARSGGQAHIVQFLYREGGRHVLVCPRYPNGVSQRQYSNLIRKFPSAKSWGWRTQRLNPQVFARGDVRHPDHKTITLHDWHSVLMNLENESRTMQHVAFID